MYIRTYGLTSLFDNDSNSGMKCKCKIAKTNAERVLICQKIQT